MSCSAMARRGRAEYGNGKAEQRGVLQSLAQQRNGGVQRCQARHSNGIVQQRAVEFGNGKVKYRVALQWQGIAE